MTIKTIETFTKGQLCIVRVTGDDGAQGCGQTAPFNADITATVLHRQIAPHALGEDASDMDGLADRCIDRNHKFPWSYVCRALGGVETALWDMRGKREGKSVCELLGGRPRPIPAYGSSMRRDIAPEDEAERLARLRDEKGFGAFKVRIGSVCGHDRDQSPGRTSALVEPENEPQSPQAVDSGVSARPPRGSSDALQPAASSLEPQACSLSPSSLPRS